MSDTPVRADGPSEDSVGYFSQLATQYAANLPAHPGFDERFALFTAWLRRLRGTAPSPACIDLGCGPGTLSIAAAQLGYDVLGIDGSDAMLELANQGAQRAGLDLALRHETLPLSDAVERDLEGSADVVLASSVIEYMADQARFLDTCARLLRPGGVALISFANSRSLVRLGERRLRHTRLYRGSILEVQQHQQNERGARGLFEAAGLTILDVDYFSMPAIAYRLWRANQRPAWLATMFLLVGRR